MKTLCKIELEKDGSYEFVKDTYVSFFKENTIFLVLDETKKSWSFLHENVSAGEEMKLRIGEIVSRYFERERLAGVVREENNKEFQEACEKERALVRPLGLAACAPCDPCVPRIPWYWKIDTPYIKGILTPFTLFGTLSAGILFTEWLVRLLKSC